MSMALAVGEPLPLLVWETRWSLRWRVCGGTRAPGGGIGISPVIYIIQYSSITHFRLVVYIFFYYGEDSLITHLISKCRVTSGV